MQMSSSTEWAAKTRDLSIEIFDAVDQLKEQAERPDDEYRATEAGLAYFEQHCRCDNSNRTERQSSDGQIIIFCDKKWTSFANIKKGFAAQIVWCTERLKETEEPQTSLVENTRDEAEDILANLFVYIHKLVLDKHLEWTPAKAVKAPPAQDSASSSSCSSSSASSS